MIQQDSKEPLVSVLLKQIDQAGSSPEFEFHLGQPLGPVEKNAVMATEAVKVKQKEAEEARVRANLAAEEAGRRELEVNAARQKAVMAAEEVKQLDKEVEQARKIALLAVEELRRKEMREAEEVKLKAKRDAEETKRKSQEARKRQKLEAEQTRLRHKDETAQARAKAKQESLAARQEAKAARDTARTAARETKLKTKAAKGFTSISADNNEFVEGSLTLAINPGAQYRKIADLMHSLSKNPDISIISTGGIAEKGSWIKLFIKQSAPLFQVLYLTPAVKEVSRKGSLVNVVIHLDEK